MSWMDWLEVAMWTNPFTFPMAALLGVKRVAKATVWPEIDERIAQLEVALAVALYLGWKVYKSVEKSL